MSLRRPGPAATAVAVGAAVATAVAVAGRVAPPEEVVRERPGRVEPVVSTTLVCPSVGGEASATGSVAVLALAGVDVSAGPAALVVEPLLGEDAEAEPLLRVGRRGAPATAEVDTGEPTAYAVRATGALAPAVVAEQSVLAAGPDLRGLSSTACGAPAGEHWFVGASGEVGRRGRLLLSNPADTSAVVDLRLWDEAGPVDAPAAEDLGIPARSQRVVPLDAFAPDSERLGVHVQVGEGRVAAAVQVRETEGLDQVGLTAIPAAVPPAAAVVVPGVPGTGRRLLRILVPGESDAIVTLRLLGPAGPFSPADASTVTVPAGTVAEVPLDAALGQDAAAVVLDSDVPVTASVRVVRPSARGLAEVAYTAATPALSGPSAALLGRAGDGLGTAVLLSAVGDQPASVTLTPLDADGAEGEPSTVSLAAGTTRAVSVAAQPGAEWAQVLIEPAEPGTVAAARLILGTDDEGVLVDLLPVASPSVSVRVPEVAGELPTGIGPARPGPGE